MELLFPVLLIAVFYFLLIRPQQKQRKKLAEIQQTLGPGSRVMTGAGLLATVVAVDDENDEVIVEVAPGVTNTYVRRAIVNVLSSPETPLDDSVETDEDSLDDSTDDAATPRDDRDDLDRALDEIENTTDSDSETTGSRNGASGDDSK